MLLCSVVEASPEDVKAASLAIPKLPQLKAVLFDVDGTLADSDPLHYLAFREILSEVSSLLSK